ncbi:carbon-monoxide dehydrogenase medium subunit [Streptomyces sp. Amel2xB2]|uniref:FAD binding domain-containing protein n=1 Tax=Streptomyces sp. Amel2xB2 TaxID=1305829 RepID=UPI000DBAB324|nr:FAD binding domain-containing protein [Streptomyces sp. Amel2xB2]RAJ71202.1 carbon-monoxide dehydrogenase medium subunit [Streptomyces sp. Amel2xB2]
MSTLAPGPAPVDAPRPPVSVVVPRNLDEALALLASDGTAVLGGGVGHTLARHHRTPVPGTLVSVTGLPGLSSIRQDDDRIVIGAGTTLASCAASDALTRAWPVVAEACGVVATGRIRRLVTIGGNIAARDDTHDPPVALTAVGATLRVRGANGTRTLAVDGLAGRDGLRPGELIESVVLPPRGPEHGRTGSAYRKFLARGVWEYACVHVAATVTLAGDGSAARLTLAVGSVEGGPVAVGLSPLLGRPVDTGLIDEAAHTAAAETRPYDDVKGSAAYKTHMIEEFSRRALTEAAHRARNTEHRQEEDR